MNKIHNNFDTNSTLSCAIDLAKYNFLIVDKDFFSRNLIRSELHQIGGQFFVDAANIQEAIDIIKNTHIDFIITELNFPGASGFDLINFIKSSKEEQKKFNIPIIIATTSTKQDDVIKAGELGVLEFLAKPFSPNELKKKIMNAAVRFGMLINNNTYSQKLDKNE